MSGKGSSPRPFSVSQEEYTKRWDMIFGRDLDKKSDDNKEKSEDLSNKKEEEVKE